METDPRGQLGGLESTDAIRERHAAASHSYRCPACAKSNAEIIQECTELAKASEITETNVEIPTELKLGWKDELGKESEEARAKGPEASETARLAEGFVKTSDHVVAETSSKRLRDDRQTPTPAELDETHAVASATRAQTQPAVTQDLQPAQVPIRADDGVPVWVDRAIVIVVVILIAMIAKALLEE